MVREFVAGVLTGLMLIGATVNPAWGSHNNGDPTYVYTHNHLRLPFDPQYVPVYGPDPNSACFENGTLSDRTDDASANPDGIFGGYSWTQYTDVNLQYQGPSAGGCYPDFERDMQVNLICDPPPFPGYYCAAYQAGGGWQAVTVRTFEAAGSHRNITYATMILDPEDPWWEAQSDPPAQGSWGGPFFDMWSVIEHELGHALGLEHFSESHALCPDTNTPQNLRSTMCPVPSSSNDSIDNAQRNPDNSDDIAAVNEGY